MSHKLHDIFARKKIFYDHQKNPTLIDTISNQYRTNRVKMGYEEKKFSYREIGKENDRITKRIQASLENNYKKNLQHRDTRLVFKRDPSSKKFVLNNSLVFEGGRYRYSGEKYLTISRKNSLTESLSNQGSQKSLARSVRSTRVPTIENFHLQEDYQTPKPGNTTSKSKFDVKVSIANWRTTSGRSRGSRTKDHFLLSSNENRTPRSSSRMIEENSKMLISKGLNFKTSKDSIRREMPTESNNLNSSMDSISKASAIEKRYRDQLRGKMSGKFGSQRTRDSLWLK